MKVTVKNLGIISQAEFEMGDLTIICGANNTGKTYATYALYGFLIYWNENYAPELLEKDELEELFQNGYIKIHLEDIKNKSNEIISSACKRYLTMLPTFFAAPNKYFENTDFLISLDREEIKEVEEFNQIIGLKSKPALSIIKRKNEPFLSINIIAKSEDIEKIDKKWIMYVVSSSILKSVFGDIFVTPFIASAERTGAAIFYRELDFTRNRLLEQMSNSGEKIDPQTLLNTYYDKGYALPVNRNVDFVRDLGSIPKNDGVIVSNNPEILTSFGDILGGEYKSTKDGLYFVPSKNKTLLKMGESSSSVRSLLDVGFYIRYMAKPGDILMIDEPEMNMNPANQRLMARLLVRLVNAGVKVFITTHSDYILKEFNTLIMLKRGGAANRNVMKEYGYDENELLDAANVRAYVAQEAHIKIEGGLRIRKRHTLLPAPINEYGIEIENFDDTINLMNAIQKEIIFGTNENVTI
jgi:AAA15 family ATPase/GTPase